MRPLVAIALLAIIAAGCQQQLAMLGGPSPAPTTVAVQPLSAAQIAAAASLPPSPLSPDTAKAIAAKYVRAEAVFESIEAGRFADVYEAPPTTRSRRPTLFARTISCGSPHSRTNSRSVRLTARPASRRGRARHLLCSTT